MTGKPTYEQLEERVRRLERVITDHGKWKKERDRLRRMLLNSHKVGAYGSLARGIVHEFNNVLGIIMAYVEMDLKRTGAGDRVHQDLKKILHATQRAKNLVKQIPPLSLGGSDEPQPTEIALLVKGAAKWLEASLPLDVSLRTNIPSGLGTVLVNPEEIHQVLMHLAGLVSQFLEIRGGQLHIGVESVCISPRDPLPSEEMCPGRYLALWIRALPKEKSDQPGKGLRLLESPDETQPGMVEGTLGFIRGVAGKHGGALVEEFGPDGDFCYTIYFPERSHVNEDGSAQESDLPGGSESLLFVDDERELVALWVEMLRDLGYRATGAYSGRQALELFKGDPPGFDLVLTDRTMPIMPGERLTREIKKIRPDIPVVMLTGHAGVMTHEMLRQKGLKGCLHKPLSAREVTSTIRRILDNQVERTA